VRDGLRTPGRGRSRGVVEVARRRFGDVIVVLPGITGSVLRRDDKDVWAVSPGAAFQALLALGRSVKELTLDNDDEVDGITATRLVQDVHLLPGFWEIDGYTKTQKVLADTLTADPGKNLFAFPYDWRRDNRIAARQLAEQAPRWLGNWRRESGNADAKLVLVGHSMGGLVARYYLEVLGGWRDTWHLITFGTPYRGSVNAIDSLVHGMKKGIGPLSIDLTPLLRSFTSIYQLLPVVKVVITATDVDTGRVVRRRTLKRRRDGSFSIELARVPPRDLPAARRRCRPRGRRADHRSHHRPRPALAHPHQAQGEPCQAPPRESRSTSASTSSTRPSTEVGMVGSRAASTMPTTCRHSPRSWGTRRTS